jgi:hypothetical protein
LRAPRESAPQVGAHVGVPTVRGPFEQEFPLGTGPFELLQLRMPTRVFCYQSVLDGGWVWECPLPQFEHLFDIGQKDICGIADDPARCRREAT